MIIIKTQAEVKHKSPKQVYDWWLNLDSEKYCKWLQDHKAWVWKGKKSNNGTNLGRKVFIHEFVEGFEFKFSGRLIEAQENRYLLFQHSYLPLSFSLRFDHFENGTKVIFTLTVGFTGLLGWLLDPIIKLSNGKNLKKSHVVEEHKLLEKII